jgi:hypothetical protein
VSLRSHEVVPFLVCLDCRKGLLELGAELESGKREGTLEDRCEAHYSSVPVHAMHRVWATDAQVEAWRARYADHAFVPPVPHEDQALVAQMACRLLTAREYDVRTAVIVARQILAQVKGEATT